MKIIFYGNKQGNIFDKLIRWWTSPLADMFNGKWKDSYSHCEILFSDGMMFSASQYENRTRYRRHNRRSKSWVVIDITGTTSDEMLVRFYCDRIEGKRYDYLGILGFIFGTPDSKSKWFCSEACTSVLQNIGMCKTLTSGKTSPNALYLDLININ